MLWLAVHRGLCRSCSCGNLPDFTGYQCGRTKKLVCRLCEALRCCLLQGPGRRHKAPNVHHHEDLIQGLGLVAPRVHPVCSPADGPAPQLQPLLHPPGPQSMYNLCGHGSSCGKRLHSSVGRAFAKGPWFNSVWRHSFFFWGPARVRPQPVARLKEMPQCNCERPSFLSQWGTMQPTLVPAHCCTTWMALCSG